ncbi:MAG: hypothetical protein QNJ81_02185 [Acidimicrobiia bacterium]|nr:hypothetical protein [Acidimicrobiia bacterium]
MNQYLLFDDQGNAFIDREQRVIQRLVQQPDMRAYLIVDTGEGAPALKAASLGPKEEVVARVVVKDLVVGGKSVAETQVQVAEESSGQADPA